MKPHIEKEYKTMITKEDYEFYLKNLPLKTFVQTNHYYSAPSRNHVMRIREVNGILLFTLKVKDGDVRKEYEFEIKENSLDDPRILELMKEFNLVKPEYIGDMVTTRSIHEYEYGEFCLDKNEYLGHIDYEIEFELHDSEKDNYEELMNILKMRNIEYIPSPKSKYGRYLKILELNNSKII